MLKSFLHIVLLWGSFATMASLSAQEVSPVFAEPDERLFIESKWRYTYTLHPESNTIIHKADDQYSFFLYFKYDYTYHEYLNGKLTKGNWNLEGRNLSYSFQHVDKFEIVQLNKSILVLEFTQRNSKGAYQYHFVRVESKDAPFEKPANELPEVIVEAENPYPGIVKEKKEKKGWIASIFQKFKKRQEYIPVPEPTYINVDLIGGGYYGGIDPVLKDFIQIKTDGRLVKEFQSVSHGLLVTKKNIPRTELEMFADYVVKQGFFDFERIYDCTDQACQKRKEMKPKPVPLRLSIAYGDKKKVVTLAIWGQDNLGIKYVDYPPALDNIIDAIQRMANRLEEPVVKK
ncbi:MAG: hypothetical protein H6577_06515 [Lewinellaceae bacterium]|nr:hypothetical protein [Saprospiraceae bacterium]MCB9337761.1 hypothetical protein [Lewinellaceae bacterium]